MKKTISIYVVVEGGCLRSVYTDAPEKRPVAVELIDLDNNPDAESDVDDLDGGGWDARRVW